MFYTKSIKEISKEFDVDIEVGLSSEQVTKSQEKHGKNILEQTKQKSPWVIFFSQFHSFIIYILLFAVVISLVSGEWIDATVILLILLFNAIFGFIQEYKAGKAIDALK
jgi:Ca2+-transporting ATPase